jgi:hypothetical protein
MGLSVSVGLLSDLRMNDEAGYLNLRQEIERLNQFLAEQGLTGLQEPEQLPDDAIFSAQMLGYSGLHHLRYYAACLALGMPEPRPVPYGKAPALIEDEYWKELEKRLNPGFLSRLLNKKQSSLPYEHLIVHSDAEGYYVPCDFEHVLFPAEHFEIPGGMVGSTQRLLGECQDLATRLEIPPNLHVQSEELWEAADAHPGDGPKWKRYGIESFTCVVLMRACKASLNYQAALIFC